MAFYQPPASSVAVPEALLFDHTGVKGIQPRYNGQNDQHHRRADRQTAGILLHQLRHDKIQRLDMGQHPVD